ncbi:hypothetical protein [Paenibacillus durus]|uniref:Uncharacterized protein n=1 Tax=Paenibacillus durus ATCC 35681 TaxID=1333534 RepID=A0A0F7FBF6_PAEDU|nr:hypothetical protein [Paenibacillus durus]AKG35644.1 hypothetical protein VK70_14550 [Paenibacillus durus ATCC 35681]
MHKVATGLRGKLQNGDTLTADDVQEARIYAERYPSPTNLALYSQIKRDYENPSERPAPAPEPPKVTAEDVEAARVAAQRNPTPAVIARWALAKREYERGTADESN